MTCPKCGSTERTKPYARHPNGDCAPCRRARSARYNKTDKGRASSARYNKTDKGRASSARYNKTDKGRASYARYSKTDKGKANRRICYLKKEYAIYV